MSTNKNVKCKLCGKKYVSKQALIDHIDKYHSDSIPEGWNAARYENYLRTGKTEGHCVYCKKETGWNDTTGKYNRMCGSEACKKKARELANKNYIGLHGKPYSINDPEQQKKMVYGRKNSGKYTFVDEDTGKKYVAMYDSSYGKDFLEMIDTFLNWDGADIIAPSPHTYYYEYEGKNHFYIPDVYSTSLNLEIELKDGGDNPNTHPKIQAVDKVKEKKKDEVMASLKDQVNYIKICNKDYTEFFALLSRLKDKDVCQLPKWNGKLESITEASSNITGNTHPQTFSSYHLEDKKVENPGGWDEELYYSTIQDAIKDRLYSLSHRSLDSATQKGRIKQYVYTMLKGYAAAYIGSIEISWYDYWDRYDPQYEFYWDEIVKIDAPVEVEEGVIDFHMNLLKRNKLLKDPMLNYDKLMKYYRKRLFYDNLSKREWQYTYNELINVRDYLQSVVNKTHGENDERMEYEAKKALQQVNDFISYMDNYDTKRLPVSESTGSNTVPIYIIAYRYRSPFATMVRLKTHSDYNHIALALSDDFEHAYTFSRRTDIDNHKMGFTEEPLSYMVSTDKSTMIKVLRVDVSRKSYSKLQSIIKDYIDHKDDTKFNWGGMFDIVNKKAIDNDDLDTMAMVCSTFVDYTLKEADVDLTKKPNSNLVTPADIANSEKNNKNVTVVYQGLGRDFNPSVLQESLLMEACKNVNEARKFVYEVGKLAKKYDANYFLVTDGASGIHNDGNPAVKHARDEHIKWEKNHGGDPDEDWTGQFESDSYIIPASESTFIEAYKDEDRFYPVFILLSYTGTNMAKLIKSFTHDPYAHSSISFDTELTNMVSFNRGGMVIENIQKDLWKEKAAQIKYSLYMYLATAEEYDAMRNFVNELLGRKSKLKYNILGLTNFIFGRGSEREDKFFCSEFVASVINAGDKKVVRTKPYMTSPYMLAKNKNFKFIKKGLIKNYDSKVVDNIIRDYLEGGGYTNVTIE